MENLKGYSIYYPRRPLVCLECGQVFSPSREQELKNARGHKVFCGRPCRNRHWGRFCISLKRRAKVEA